MRQEPLDALLRDCASLIEGYHYWQATEVLLEYYHRRAQAEPEPPNGDLWARELALYVVERR